MPVSQQKIKALSHLLDSYRESIGTPSVVWAAWRKEIRSTSLNYRVPVLSSYHTLRFTEQPQRSRSMKTARAITTLAILLIAVTLAFAQAQRGGGAGAPPAGAAQGGAPRGAAAPAMTL